MNIKERLIIATVCSTFIFIFLGSYMKNFGISFLFGFFTFFIIMVISSRQVKEFGIREREKLSEEQKHQEDLEEIKEIEKNREIGRYLGRKEIREQRNRRIRTPFGGRGLFK